jgi:hypothetical protein
MAVLRHSSFVADASCAIGKASGFRSGWAPGAVSWVAASEGRSWRRHGRGMRCAAEGFDVREFVVEAV